MDAPAEYVGLSNRLDCHGQGLRSEFPFCSTEVSESMLRPERVSKAAEISYAGSLDTPCRPAGLIARDRSKLREGGACLPVRFQSRRGLFYMPKRPGELGLPADNPELRFGGRVRRRSELLRKIHAETGHGFSAATKAAQPYLFIVASPQEREGSEMTSGFGQIGPDCPCERKRI
jgi:hypothetical protein